MSTTDVSREHEGSVAQYCGRCARQCEDLRLDDLTLWELCPDCRQELIARRLKVHILDSKR
jgi:hypothetical protein